MRSALILTMMLCTASAAAGQDTASSTASGRQAPPTTDEGAVEWSFSAATYTYVLPDEGNYAQPTVTADRRRLHFEARYNYEELDAGSAWIGVNFSGGETIEWTVTPSVGGVFGSVSGVAPGYKGELNWRMLGVWSEGEYVFAAGDPSESFFYNWTEVTLAPAEWWRVGLVTQRTHAYAADREIQRGLLAGFTYKNIDSVVYVLNPDDSRPIAVLAVTLGF